MTRAAAAFGVVLLLALVALLPMRAALAVAGLGEAGLTARRVDGTVWSGSLADAAAAGLRLGDVSARVSALPLVAGRARIALAGSADAPAPFAGTLEAGRTLLAAEHASGILPAAGLFDPLPVTTLNLDDVTVRFQDGICSFAQGRVSAGVSGEVAGLPLAGALAGEARCRGDRLLLPMRGAGGEAVDLAIGADGRYTADVLAHPPDPAAATKLAAFGFQPGPAGYRLSVEGRF